MGANKAQEIELVKYFLSKSTPQTKKKEQNL